MIPKYGNKAKLCYDDTDSAIYIILTEDFYAALSPDADRWFDTSNYNPADNRPLPIGKNRKLWER